MSPFESPATPDKKQSGFAEKIAGYQEELAGVEMKLMEIERLKKVRSGFGPAWEVLKSIDGTDDAVKKLEAFMDSMNDCVAEKGIEDLLARKRELRQLMEQAKIDAGE